MNYPYDQLEYIGMNVGSPERNKGFESAMTLWAISDLDRAANDLMSAVNRLANRESVREPGDAARIRNAWSKINFAFVELSKMVEVKT